jgi:hypothetical protein
MLRRTTAKREDLNIDGDTSGYQLEQFTDEVITRRNARLMAASRASGPPGPS